MTSKTIAGIPYTSLQVLALPDAYWNQTADAPMHGKCYAFANDTAKPAP